MNNEIMVSVVCMTYNQEKYIKKCINSLINQKTTFQYEIIIHDDCSTDGTVSILKKYKEKYKEKICLILQETNQYSKGVNILEEIVMPYVRGKYIAFCEGDDYWCDVNKLQLQVSIMERNPQCWICAHSVSIVNEDDSKLIGKIEPSDTDCIFSVEEVINGDGGFVGTNSLMMKKEIFGQNYTFLQLSSLDYFIQILGSLHGGMVYLAKKMSVYRYFSVGSWSSRMYGDKEKFCQQYNKVILTLQRLDKETYNKYHNEIENKILKQEVEILKLKKMYKNILNNKDLLRVLSLKERIKITIMAIMPWIKDISEKRRKR